MGAPESMKEDAPRSSPWRRVTAIAGVALGTCLLAPLAISCDARSPLTGELCAPTSESSNLRGRRLAVQKAYHHVVHHVRHIYHGLPGTHAKTLVLGAPAHAESKVYGAAVSKEFVDGKGPAYVGDLMGSNTVVADHVHQGPVTVTHHVVHHYHDAGNWHDSWGSAPSYIDYPSDHDIHYGGHHWNHHHWGTIAGTSSLSSIDCAHQVDNWYYEWDAHKKATCCAIAHVGCPGTWSGAGHWSTHTVSGGVVHSKHPAYVSDDLPGHWSTHTVSGGVVHSKHPAYLSDDLPAGWQNSETVDGDHWLDSDTVDGGFVNGKGPAVVSDQPDQWLDSDTVDGGFVNGKGPADVSGELPGFVNGKGPAVVSDQPAQWLASDNVEGGSVSIDEKKK